MPRLGVAPSSGGVLPAPRRRAAGALPTAVVAGTIGTLLLGTASGVPLHYTAPLLLAAAIFVVSHRALLRWRSLVVALVVVILIIPIRRYTLPVSLPFELEPYRILVAFVILGWGASLLIDPRVKIRPTPFDAQLLAISFATLGSVAVNSGRVSGLGLWSDVVKSLTFLASFLLVYYFIVSVVRTQADIERVLKILVAGGAVVALFSLIESRTGYNVFDHLGFLPFLKELALPTASGDVNGFARGGRLRVYGSAEHPIALGAALVLMVPPAIYLLRRTGQRRWWAAIALLAVGALATVSRTGVLMLVVVGVVFLCLRPRETRRLWPGLLPALVVIHFALPHTLGILKSSFFPSGGLIQEQNGPLIGERTGGRLAKISPTLHRISGDPLLGVGYATNIVTGPNTNALTLDDQWLGTLAETGFMGFVAWIWFFVRGVRRLGAAARADLSIRGWLFVGLTASLAAYAVGMFTYDAFAFIQSTFILFILLALGVAALRVRDETEDRSSSPT